MNNWRRTGSGRTREGGTAHERRRAGELARVQFAIKKLAAAIKPPLVREQVKGKEGRREGGKEGRRLHLRRLNLSLPSTS